MESDLGTPLEWVAVAHYNTEHPHVHATLRGIGADGRPFRLSRDYIRQGIRCAAEDLCTRQLGYRTEFDTAAAQRREVQAHRYTSLDRALKRDAVWPDSGGPGHSSQSCGTRIAAGAIAMCGSCTSTASKTNAARKKRRARGTGIMAGDIVF